MINIRMRQLAFVVMLVATGLPYRALSQSKAEKKGDVTELLEMELSDVKKENSRLTAELDKLRAAQAGANTKGSFSILKKENGLLKDAIIKLDGQISDLNQTLGKTQAELATAREELARLKKGGKGSKADAKELSEMQARCKNLDDENSILKAEVDKQRMLLKEAKAQSAKLSERCTILESRARETASGADTAKGQVAKLTREIEQLRKRLALSDAELKKARSGATTDKSTKTLRAKIEELQAVEAQRKAAFDTLFKDLADMKRKLKEKDNQIAEVKAETEARGKMLRSKDDQIVLLQSKLAKLRRAADGHAAEVATLQEKVSEANQKVALKEKDIKREMAKRQAIEVELSRIKMTDDQRKKAMDDVLTKLAAAENSNQEYTAKIKGLEERLRGLEARSDAESRRLKDELKASEAKAGQLELELRQVKAARDELESKLHDNTVAAESDASKIVALEADLARMKATDSQRKKAMDKLLLEISQAEDTHTKDQEEIRAARRQVTTLKTELESLKSEKEKSVADSKELKLLREKVARLQEAQQKQQAVAEENAGLKSQIKNLQRDLEVARKSQQDTLELKRKLETLQGELELAKATSVDGDKLRAQIEKLNKELVASHDEVDALRKQVARKSSDTKQSEQVRRLEQENGNLTKQVADLEKKLGLAEQKLAKAEAQLQQNREQLKKKGHDGNVDALVAMERQEWQKTRAELQQTIKKLNDDVAQLKTEIAQQKKIADEQTTLAQKLRSDLVKAGNEKDACEKARANLEKQVGQLNAELAELKKHDADTMAKLEKLKADVAKVGNKKGDLEKARVTLEKQIGQLKAEVADLKKRNADATDKLQKFKEDLAKANREKSDLEKKNIEGDKQLEGLRQQYKDATDRIKALQDELAKVEKEKAELAMDVKRLKNRKVDVRQTPLFKELEQVNVTLREKIVQIEGERQRLEREVKKLEKRNDRYDADIDHEKGLRKKVENELADAKSREEEYKTLIEKYMAQIPKLESEVNDLSDKLAAKEKLLNAREEEVKALKIELEKRAHRLVKAERVAEILNKSREDVLHASDKEKLNMYYNMAAVYAKDGRYRDAEQEYLKALKLNPMDADIHYNLGILYDDELKEPEKAIMHYRRYLKLNPHGPDAENVRNWLLRLEMKIR